MLSRVRELGCATITPHCHELEGRSPTSRAVILAVQMRPHAGSALFGSAKRDQRPGPFHASRDMARINVFKRPAAQHLHSRAAPNERGCHYWHAPSDSLGGRRLGPLPNNPATPIATCGGQTAMSTATK